MKRLPNELLIKVFECLKDPRAERCLALTDKHMRMLWMMCCEPSFHFRGPGLVDSQKAVTNRIGASRVAQYAKMVTISPSNGSDIAQWPSEYLVVTSIFIICNINLYSDPGGLGKVFGWLNKLKAHRLVKLSLKIGIIGEGPGTYAASMVGRHMRNIQTIISSLQHFSFIIPDSLYEYCSGEVSLARAKLLQSFLPFQKLGVLELAHLGDFRFLVSPTTITTVRLSGCEVFRGWRPWMTNFPEFPSVQSLSIDYGESQEQDFPATLPLFDDLHLGIARIFPKLVELNWLRFKRASLAVTLSSEKFQLPKCIRVWRFLEYGQIHQAASPAQLTISLENVLSSGKSNSALSCQDVGMADWGDVHARNIDRGVDIDMELEVVNGGRLLRIRSWVNGICNRLQVLTLDPPSCWYYT